MVTKMSKSTSSKFLPIYHFLFKSKHLFITKYQTNIMTTSELNQKIEKMLEENNLDWQSIHLWIIQKGYVIITQEQYDNLEVIDPNGAVP